MPPQSGRHFLQIPGPTNVPDRVLRAIGRPVIDHRGPEFRSLSQNILENLGRIFQTSQPIVIYPSSGTGAWEAALANTMSPGDRVLMAETGYFAGLWRDLAAGLGLEVDFIEGDWRTGVDAGQIGARLTDDKDHAVKAVAVVHNETSTGVKSDIEAVRKALDEADHPALLMVDTISSLGSMDYRHDAWGVDVAVAGSQKGLMLPPGLGFNAVSEKALKACAKAALPRSYWNWRAVIEANRNGLYPYTPSTNLLFGLRESTTMLLEEGLDNVFARHDRFAEATRRAVAYWGLETVCADQEEASSSLTAVFTPEGHDADALRRTILERLGMSLGNGLGRLKGRVFRIGHLGSFNDLMLAGTLSGVEMGFNLAGVPHTDGGVSAALNYLAATNR